VDYGFNNANGNYSKKMIEYNRNEPARPIMNTACVLTDRFSPLALGIKVKMAFSVGCGDLLDAQREVKARKWELPDDDFSEFTPPQKTMPVETKDTIPRLIVE
jgi:hypothetical protein